MSSPAYIVRRSAAPPEGAGRWDGPSWKELPLLEVNNFHARSSDHRPATRVKLQYDDHRLYALFAVNDRFVRCIHTDYESDTYKDSCVELFLRPNEQGGYFALEINCGGAFSLRFIEDWTRTPDRFAKWSAVPPEAAAGLHVAHSMPAIVEPEIGEPTDWWVEVGVPIAVLEEFCGPLRPLDGRVWRANAFKCGDQTSHPHWASWAPIGEALNFHQPEYFGGFVFGDHAA